MSEFWTDDDFWGDRAFWYSDDAANPADVPLALTVQPVVVNAADSLVRAPVLALTLGVLASQHDVLTPVDVVQALFLTGPGEVGTSWSSLIRVDAVPLAVSAEEAQTATGATVAAPALALVADVLAPVYAGRKFVELETIESGFTQQVILSTPFTQPVDLETPVD